MLNLFGKSLIKLSDINIETPLVVDKQEQLQAHCVYIAKCNTWTYRDHFAHRNKGYSKMDAEGDGWKMLLFIIDLEYIDEI